MNAVIETLPDIPRWYTALAEWMACLVYVMIPANRPRRPMFVLTLGAGLAALQFTQWFAGSVPIAWWTVGMLLAVLVMYLLVLACVPVSPLAAAYLAARAFVLGELVASLQWQLHSFFFRGDAAPPQGYALALLACVYGGSFVLAYFAEVRHFSQGEHLEAGPREVISAGAIAVATFSMSNISFINANTPFSGRLGIEIFYIRTLVDLCGYVALYAQQEQQRELQARAENEAMNGLLRSQHEQYLSAKRSIDEVTRTYHDMKHHITAIRGEKDPRRKAAYLDELENSIRDYGLQVRTGNGVMDTILTAKSLYAAEHSIDVNVVADGKLLDFMGVLDICTIVGNALDNAIENTLRVQDPERRFIRVALFAQDNLVMLRFENPYDGMLRRENGRLATLKSDPERHGFGLRNIETAAEKYGGSVSVQTRNEWFSLRILLPRPLCAEQTAR